MRSPVSRGSTGMRKLSDWMRRPLGWAWFLVFIGLALRAYHYGRDPSMWHDEAYLVLNVLGKGFRDLLGPLFFSEAAPPLFLWLERGVALALGDNIYSLRLPPFLASCAALALMVPVARRALSPAALPWAVLLFACSDHLLWHACEAKPYALDVLAATGLIALFVLTSPWRLAARLALFALLAPLLIFLSYPGSFLCGGLLVALLPEVWREKGRKNVLGYSLLALVVLGAFVLLFVGPIRAQRCTAMDDCWLNHFPDWDRPWAVPGWALLGCFEVFRYCFDPAGQALAPLAVLGGVSLWRSGSRPLVLLLTVPVLLALVAACFRAYPFGGARVVVYATPALALLVAEGAAQALAWLRARQDRALPLLARGALILLLLAPLGRAAQRVAVPWPRADCQGAAAFVLSRLQAGDGIVANHPEYLYYFRGLGPAFGMVGRKPSLGTSPATGWGGAAFCLLQARVQHSGKPLWSVAWYPGAGDPGPPGNPFVSKDRLWLVLTGVPRGGLPGMLRELPLEEWRVLERHDFDLTSVILCERKR